MNLRQNTLLQIMLKEGSFQTIDSLAVLLNCSEKTLRNDIKDINTFLKDNNFETSIQLYVSVFLDLFSFLYQIIYFRLS